MISRAFVRVAVPFACAVALLFLCACATSDDGPPAYYVDSAAGNDTNDGRSAGEAWQTLEKVNSVEFTAGDRLLFKAGSEFRGQLAPKGSGAEGSPIVVDMYGEGDKPLIAAEGRFHEALLLQNQNFWEVNNLQLTNLGPTEETFRYGARLRSWDFGTMRHIQLKNLYVHDVNGSLVKNDEGEGHGIVWENGGDQVKSRFDGILIEKCRLVRTDRNGISGYTSYPAGRENRFPSLNVVIRDNLLEDIGGDAIKPWGCDGALVEHNVVRKARQRCDDYAAGIWPWDSDNTLIQFNEVSGVKGYKDGQAFDNDGYCHNTVFQYNYSHDNDGGFMLLCVRDNPGVVIRYNISQNDGTRLFHVAGDVRDVSIYNNVFYLGPEIDAHLFLWTGGKQWPDNVAIRNNIFYAEGVGRNSSGTERRREPVYDGTYITKPGFGGAKNVVFEGNTLYGTFEGIPAAWRAMIRDPQLEGPGTGADGFDSLAGYKLRAGSPLIRAGIPIPDNGARDFWGNPVSPNGKPSIGAHEPPAE